MAYPPHGRLKEGIPTLAEILQQARLSHSMHNLQSTSQRSDWIDTRVRNRVDATFQIAVETYRMASRSCHRLSFKTAPEAQRTPSRTKKVGQVARSPTLVKSMDRQRCTRCRAHGAAHSASRFANSVSGSEFDGGPWPVSRSWSIFGMAETDPASRNLWSLGEIEVRRDERAYSNERLIAAGSLESLLGKCEILGFQAAHPYAEPPNGVLRQRFLDCCF